MLRGATLLAKLFEFKSMIEEVLAICKIDTSSMFNIEKPYFFITHDNSIFQMRDLNKRFTLAMATE